MTADTPLTVEDLSVEYREASRFVMHPIRQDFYDRMNGLVKIKLMILESAIQNGEAEAKLEQMKEDYHRTKKLAFMVTEARARMLKRYDGIVRDGEVTPEERDYLKRIRDEMENFIDGAYRL